MDEESTGGMFIPLRTDQFMVEESTVGMVIPPEITRKTMTPPKEWLFCRELQLMDEEYTGGIVIRRELPVHGLVIQRRKGHSSGFTSSLMRNPPEKWLFWRELPAQGR
jgi:hypothetical protein